MIPNLDNLLHLQFLDVAYNYFTGLIPASLCKVPMLSTLYICAFNGSGCPLLTAVPQCLLGLNIERQLGSLPTYINADLYAPTATPLLTSARPSVTLSSSSQSSSSQDTAFEAIYIGAAAGLVLIMGIFCFVYTKSCKDSLIKWFCTCWCLPLLRNLFADEDEEDRNEEDDLDGEDLDAFDADFHVNFKRGGDDTNSISNSSITTSSTLRQKECQAMGL